MAEIALLHGQIAWCDEVDLPVLISHRWYLNNHGYVRSGSGRSFRLMHHMVIGRPPTGMVVDHVDGNRLNNKRENLRFCTRAENSRNRKKHANNRSGFKGVWLDSRRKKCWRAQINFDGTKINLGSFYHKRDAFAAYAAAAQKLHHHFCRLV